MALPTEVNLEHPAEAGSPEILDGHVLALYLCDHHALLVALGELASPHGHPGAIRRSAGVRRAARAGGVRPGGRRGAPAPAGQRAVAGPTRGRLVVREGRALAAVTELEGCKILLESDRALWSGLAHLAIGPADSGERARRAEELLAEAVGLRVDAFHGATHHRVDAVGQPR